MILVSLTAATLMYMQAPEVSQERVMIAQGDQVSACPENTPAGRQPDLLDCKLKVGMSLREVNQALEGSPTRVTPGRNGDTNRFYDVRVDGKTLIATVIFDKQNRVKFWRSFVKTS